MNKAAVDINKLPRFCSEAFWGLPKLGLLGKMVPMSEFTLVSSFSPELVLEEPDQRKDLDTSTDVVGLHLPQEISEDSKPQGWDLV